jgi:hypothetical protein
MLVSRRGLRWRGADIGPFGSRQDLTAQQGQARHVKVGDESRLAYTQLRKSLEISPNRGAEPMANSSRFGLHEIACKPMLQWAATW